MLIRADFVFALLYFQSQASHPKGNELIEMDSDFPLMIIALCTLQKVLASRRVNLKKSVGKKEANKSLDVPLHKRI